MTIRLKKVSQTVMPLLIIGALYLFASAFFLARSSLSRTSTCHDNILHQTLGIDDTNITATNGNCWMESSVDQLVILVVDALRFDFAQQSFPKAFGQRLSSSSGSSQLFQFVADPPTVTMQRLKGLTTGGLPTFADISGNFGGGYVEEDSWMELLRRRQTPMAFVGDDTWVDLFPFPKYWKEAHPFPSFNTRDLDTVDNGVLEYLPGLLDELSQKKLDVVIGHFLGVDHVGHTYGPHTKYMTEKLQQMDDVLDQVLTRLDNDDESSKNCIWTLIFGDHGMTEGGNHGGGTPEEVQAALFSHFSSHCRNAAKQQKRIIPEISQIDLVPTISLAMGLPIPYANLGGLVPSLLPTDSTTKALALNMAQVWRYLTDYHQNANRLPGLMEELAPLFQDGQRCYQQIVALEQDETNPSKATKEEELSCQNKLKRFLNEATALGKRVWTKFDTNGMILGGSLLGIMLICHAIICLMAVRSSSKSPKTSYLRRWPRLDESLTLLFILFTCCGLTFSNSYIEQEQSISMYCLSIICLAIVVVRIRQTSVRMVLLIPLAARLHELFISGHGLDPSLSDEHFAHHSLVFLTSLLFLGWTRRKLHQQQQLSHPQKQQAFYSYSADMLTLFFLAWSWWEKRQIDTTRNGYLACRVALISWVTSLTGTILFLLRRQPLLLVFQIGVGIMIVTGPSTAASMVFFTIQVYAYQSYVIQPQNQIAGFVKAFLGRLMIRHMFFTTNHACAFNRLQYSAAFVATMEFYFVTGGISLALNTFGYELLGQLLFVSQSHQTWYFFYQLLETTFNCLSVAILRRHLMVWAIFAPRFLFSAIFLCGHCFCQILKVALL